MIRSDPHSQRQHYLEEAVRYLELGSEDGMNLAMDFLRLAGMSLPLVEIYKKRWNVLVENRRNIPLSMQVGSYKNFSIEYLNRRLKEAENEGATPPAEPWSELAVFIHDSRGEELKLTGENIRGAVQTVVGVLTPDTPDHEAMQMAADVLADRLREEQPKVMSTCQEGLENLSLPEVWEYLHLELPRQIVEICTALRSAGPTQAAKLLDRTVDELAVAGSKVRGMTFKDSRR